MTARACSILLAGVMVAVARGASAQPPPADLPGRTIFSFDESLEGWFVGGDQPTFTARISHEAGTFVAGGGAAEFRYGAGEKVLFATDRLNQGPPSGFFQRLFSKPVESKLPLVDVSRMSGFSLEVWSEVSTTLFLMVGERGGGRYVHTFGVTGGSWTSVRAPLLGFAPANDSKDDNQSLDADQVYTVALGDLRSFTSAQPQANRVLVDSFGIQVDPTSVVPQGGREEPAVEGGGEIRVRGPGSARVARVGDSLEITVTPGSRIEAGDVVDLRFEDVGPGDAAGPVSLEGTLRSVPLSPGPLGHATVQFDRPGLYRITSQVRSGKERIVIATGADTIAIVPAGAPNGWLGTCVVTDLVSVEHPGADPTLARATGVTWDRPIVSWRGIEPERGVENWELTDQLIGERVAQGFQVAPLLGHAPKWAGSDASGDKPPKNLEALTSFATRLVGRYRDRVRYWSLGNEPNWANTKMAPDTYVAMLEAFTRGARRADPAVKVLIGGLAFIDLAYLEKLYDAGIAPHFDVMSLHPYAFPSAPELDEGSDLLRRTVGVETSLAGIRKVREVMERHGDGRKPIWVTEIVWGSGQKDTDLEAKFRPFQVDLATQAKYYVRAALLARSWGADTFFLVSVHELPDAALQIFARGGVVGHDGVPKPALPALAAMIHEVGAARVAGEPPGLQAGVRGVSFESESESIHVYWAPAGEVALTVPVASQGARLVDFYGREVAVTDGEGHVNVSATPFPKYLHVPKTGVGS